MESAGEAFHLASRNSSAGYKNKRAYQVHYEPAIRQLVSEAPARREGLHRVGLDDVEQPDSPAAALIGRRRSTRHFGTDPMTRSQLASVLTHGVGVQRVIETGDDLRSYHRPFPNSGNLGSVEVFPIVLNVADVPPGIYHFDSVRHDLALLRPGSMADWLGGHVFFQSGFPGAAVALALVVSFDRLVAKYGERGWRFGYLDAGHVSQTLNLLATDLGLAVCTTAGFVDAELDRAVDADGLDRAAVLCVLIGCQPS